MPGALSCGSWSRPKNCAWIMTGRTPGAPGQAALARANCARYCAAAGVAVAVGQHLAAFAQRADQLRKQDVVRQGGVARSSFRPGRRPGHRAAAARPCAPAANRPETSCTRRCGTGRGSRPNGRAGGCARASQLREIGIAATVSRNSVPVCTRASYSRGHLVHDEPVLHGGDCQRTHRAAGRGGRQSSSCAPPGVGMRLIVSIKAFSSA